MQNLASIQPRTGLPKFAKKYPKVRKQLEKHRLKAWGGKEENVPAAQDMLRALCQANGRANLGTYDAAKGHPSVTGQLYVKGYTY